MFAICCMESIILSQRHYQSCQTVESTKHHLQNPDHLQSVLNRVHISKVPTRDTVGQTKALIPHHASVAAWVERKYLNVCKRATPYNLKMVWLGPRMMQRKMAHIPENGTERYPAPYDRPNSSSDTSGMGAVTFPTIIGSGSEWSSAQTVLQCRFEDENE